MSMNARIFAATSSPDAKSAMRRHRRCKVLNQSSPSIRFRNGGGRGPERLPPSPHLCKRVKQQLVWQPRDEGTNTWWPR